MDANSYAFQLGEFRCLSVRDGALNYPPAALFANVPPAEVEAALQQRGLGTTQVVTPYTSLLIDTGVHRVLVDAGAGDLARHAPEVFPGLDHSTSMTGSLVGHMRAGGIEPSDIDVVVITHGHPDHIGGMLTPAGGLTFPEAHYFISEPEWAFWTSDAAATHAEPYMVQAARTNLEPLRDRLTLVHDGSDLVPGIEAVAAYGHTPGHIAVSVTSGPERLVHISDTVLTPLHLNNPNWAPVFDMDPAQAAQSKTQILNTIADQDALMFAHHFPPFPSLGHVRRQHRGWTWEPINPPSET